LRSVSSHLETIASDEDLGVVVVVVMLVVLRAFATSWCIYFMVFGLVGRG